MKVALGMRSREGPWGGGNRFGQALVERLRAESMPIVDHLDDPDVDVILLVDPRRGSQSASFQDREIARYLFFTNPEAIVVHRVNECDERKGTDGVNRRLMDANLLADHTVFVSSWLRDLFFKRGLPCRSHSVILNGADRRVFHSTGHRTWDTRTPLKLVTHHWSGDWNKGFDIYQRLDGLLAEKTWRGRLEFTYVGNIPNGFRFENATHVEPLNGQRLANELRRHHVYVTGSQNEPGSMHNVEGACCGLPLLYLNSGGLLEYCAGYGIMFSPDDFEAKLREMVDSYGTWADRIRAYPRDSESMATGYLELMRDLLRRRRELIENRVRSRWLRWLVSRVRN